MHASVYKCYKKNNLSNSTPEQEKEFPAVHIADSSSPADDDTPPEEGESPLARVSCLIIGGKGRDNGKVPNKARDEYVVKITRTDDNEIRDVEGEEYRLLEKLSHRNIIKAHDFYPHEVMGPHLVLEYIDGVNLLEHIATYHAA